MATWTQLADYVRASYPVREDRGETLSIELTTPGGRSQLAFVHHERSLEGTEFAIIASSFAKVGGVDYAALLREAALHPVGGIVAMGEALLVRHAVPIAHLESPEFDNPLHLVVGVADSLEQRFRGGDDF